MALWDSTEKSPIADELVAATIAERQTVPSAKRRVRSYLLTNAGPDDEFARRLRVLVLAALLLLLLCDFRAAVHVAHPFAGVLVHAMALMLGPGRVSFALAAGLGRGVGSERGGCDDEARGRGDGEGSVANGLVDAPVVVNALDCATWKVVRRTFASKDVFVVLVSVPGRPGPWNTR